MPDIKILRSLLDDYLKMYANREDVLTTYFSDNFSGFTGGGDVLVKEKKEWVDITRRDFDQVKEPLKITLKDYSVQPLSGTIAVLTSFFSIQLPMEEHILSRETARLVLIYRKEAGEWKIVHSSISIPYYLVREGEIYPLQELVERNQFLEELIEKKTCQISDANENLKQINNELQKEIAERKQVEEALRHSNQKWEAIISASPDGIGIASLDGKLQIISDKLFGMFGYPLEEKDEYIGETVFNFIDSSHHEVLAANINKLLIDESNHKITEYLAVKRDGSRFYIEINSTVLRDPLGNPTHIFFVERDITERRKIESTIRKQYHQLKELNSTKDKFFSIIAHDLKSPMQGLIGLTAIMSEDIEDLSLSELSQLSTVINNAAKKLSKLLSNLLEWSQIQQGAISFNPVELLAADTISQNITLMSERCTRKEIAISADIPEGFKIYADEEMLNSVLRNLLSNAIKFTHKGGKIAVKCYDCGNNMVEFSVADNGIGIPKALCRKLFKIEEVVGRQGTEGEESTGLGLLLCKEFVEKHGGGMRVESVENAGSTFYFTIRKRVQK